MSASRKALQAAELVKAKIHKAYNKTQHLLDQNTRCEDLLPEFRETKTIEEFAGLLHANGITKDYLKVRVRLWNHLS